LPAIDLPALDPRVRATPWPPRRDDEGDRPHGLRGRGGPIRRCTTGAA
jgi:hypothetical protein